MLSLAKTLSKILIIGIILFSFGDAPRIFALEEEKIKELKKKSETIQDQLEKEKAQVEDIRREEDNVLDTLRETDQSIEQTRKRASASKSELDRLDKKIAENSEEIKTLTKKIESSEEEAEHRVSALYKLYKLGKLNILASSGSLNEFFQRKKALESISAYDEKLLKDLNRQKRDLEKTVKKLNVRKEEKLALKKTYDNHVREMKDKRADREKILDSIRKKKSLVLASVQSLENSAKELDAKIEVLYQESQKRIFAKAQADAEKESGSESAPKESKFSRLKGLLKMPTEGKIAAFFGPYRNPEFNVMNFRSGIIIRSPRGAAIRAVYDGDVLYSAWFKDYGNMVIIDHGDHYYTVYAHLEDVHKAKGDRVETGDVIGTVGDSGSVTGPGLHFEVRHHGKPIDPIKWLKKG